MRVEATRGLPKLNFHEELEVSSSVCRMGPRSLVFMKVKVILCTSYLSSFYIFSSWKGRFGETTRQICFAITSENKGWQRNLGSWSCSLHFLFIFSQPGCRNLCNPAINIGLNAILVRQGPHLTWKRSLPASGLGNQTSYWYTGPELAILQIIVQYFLKTIFWIC